MSQVCTCGDLCPVGASKCECGRALPLPTQPEPVVAPRVRGCTCHGQGVCVACVLNEYENGTTV